MTSALCIDNLSAGAYRLAAPPSGLRLEFDCPSAVYQALRARRADAGLLPVARFEELSHRFEPLGEYGVACAGQVRSVLLVSRLPIADLFRNRGRIYVTRKSETSRRLLGILARRTYGCAPSESRSAAVADARLLIGDDAVRAAALKGTSELVQDLGAWWFEETGLPFVFARWVVRRDLPEMQRARIAHWLEAGVRASETPEGRGALVRNAAALMDADDARTYYSAVHWRLSAPDREGLRTFLELQQEPLACARTA